MWPHVVTICTLICTALSTRFCHSFVAGGSSSTISLSHQACSSSGSLHLPLSSFRKSVHFLKLPELPDVVHSKMAERRESYTFWKSWWIGLPGRQRVFHWPRLRWMNSSVILRGCQGLVSLSHQACGSSWSKQGLDWCFIAHERKFLKWK